jgi:hypothetical protein
MSVRILVRVLVDVAPVPVRDGEFAHSWSR